MTQHDIMSSSGLKTRLSALDDVITGTIDDVWMM